MRNQPFLLLTLPVNSIRKFVQNVFWIPVALHWTVSSLQAVSCAETKLSYTLFLLLAAWNIQFELVASMNLVDIYCSKCLMLEIFSHKPAITIAVDHSFNLVTCRWCFVKNLIIIIRNGKKWWTLTLWELPNIYKIYLQILMLGIGLCHHLINDHPEKNSTRVQTNDRIYFTYI